MSSPTEKNIDQKGCKHKRTQRLSDINLICQPVPLPPPVSDEFSGVTTEEQDLQLAKNLILLSQGGNLIDQAASQQSSGTPTSQSQPPPTEMEKVFAEVEIEIERHDTIVPSRQLVESTAATTDRDYPCKNCNKKFNSFQALGGHRASHKKVRLGSDQPKVQSSTDTVPTSSGKISKLDTITNVKDEIQVNSPVATPPVLPAGKKARLHKCPKCPAVFNSGQALGGHMRKHNPLQPKTEKLNDGLDGIVIQQPLISGQDSILIQQQPNYDLDRISIQQQQQPNGSLVLDLNLPAQLDQQDILEQPPAAYLCDESPPTTKLSLVMSA